MKTNNLKLFELKKIWESEVIVVCNYVESVMDSRNLRYQISKRNFQGGLIKGTLFRHVISNKFFGVGVNYVFHINKMKNVKEILDLINFIENESKLGVVLFLVINKRVITMDYFKNLVKSFGQESITEKIPYGIVNLIKNNLNAYKKSNILLLKGINKKIENDKINANI